MLDALRNSVGSWFAKILIGLLVLSFAVWGIADVFNGIGSTSVASVGDKEISAQDYQRAYGRELDQLSRRAGQPITQEQAALFGLPQQVLGRLLAEAALDNEASKLRIGVSDEAIIKTIQETPAFQGINGYDSNRLSQFLYTMGMDEDEFVMTQQQVAERQQLANAIIGGIAVPKTMLEAFDKFNLEERRVDFITLSEDQLSDVPAPTDEELSSFFEQNKSSFRAPEYRSAKLIELAPEKIAKPENVTDADIASEYERTKDQYQNEEQRRILQLGFPTLAEAQAAAAELASGKTFAKLLEERGTTEDEIDLGLLNRNGFFDEKIADAAFALQQGEASGAIEGQFTNAILFAKEVKPASVKPLEEVKDELRTTLANIFAAEEIESLFNEVEDARAGGSTFEEVADRFGLKLETSEAFDASGKSQAEAVLNLPQGNNLVDAVFATDVGVENDPLEIGRTGFLWYEVAEVIPSRDRDLSEVKDQAVADWTADKKANLLQEKAEVLLAEVQGGKSLQDVASAEGLTVTTSGTFTRNGGEPALSGAAITAAFSGPNGTSAQVAGNSDNRILLVVKDSTTPAFIPESENVKRVEAQLTGALEDSLLSEFVSRLEQVEGIRINQALFAQLSGLNNN